MKRIFFLMLGCVLVAQTAWAGRAKLDAIAEDPYISALVINAANGDTLFEDRADTVIYPASVLKLMVFFIVLEQVEQGILKLDTMVQVTKEAAQMGGSQVYLDSKEQFSVEDLIYALIIQSANDAAVALATHVAGSKDGFVALMNKKAQELGMKDTRFYSVHGLPPSEGQKVDLTTARDLAILCRELIKNPETFRYTGTREREFRDGKFIMRTHNHLLATVDGCDGFKTGYFRAAGFSMVATAERRGVRIIAIVLGSKDRKVRDAKAKELLSKGFGMVPPKIEQKVVQPVATSVEIIKKDVVYPQVKETSVVIEKDRVNTGRAEQQEAGIFSDSGWGMFLLGVAVGLIPSVLLGFSRFGRRTKRRHLLS